MSASRNLARIARRGVITVDTAQDLRDLANFGELPETVVTKGALVAGDLGGGAWDKVMGSVAVDNLGTVLEPAVVPAVRYHRRIDGNWLAAWFGVRPGAANEAHNESIFQTMLDACSDSGGGTILFSEDGEYLLTNSNKEPRSFVRLRGASQATVLRVSYDAAVTGGKNIFMNEGWHPADLGSYTYYGLNNISSGDNQVTLNNAADSSNFSVGNCAWVSSTAGLTSGSNFFPYFSEMVKIVDISGGVLTLEHPIELPVDAPRITTAAGQRAAVQNFGIEDMTLIAQDPGAAMRINQLYKGAFRNLTILNTAFTITGNGYTRCVFENINGTFSRGAIELKSGTYKARVRNVNVGFDGAGDLYGPTGIISFGEFTRELAYNGITIDCKGRDKPDSALIYTGGRDIPQCVSLSDVRICNVGTVATSVFSMQSAEPTFPYEPGVFELRNIKVIAQTASTSLNIWHHPLSATPYKIPKYITFDNVSIEYATPPAASVKIDWANRFVIDTCSFGVGLFRIVETVGSDVYIGDLSIVNSHINQIQTSAATANELIDRVNYVGNRRNGAEAAYKANTSAIPSNFTPTTPTDAFPPLVIPSGLNFYSRDYLEAKLTCILEGPLERHVIVEDSDGTFIDFTIPANKGGSLMSLYVKVLQISSAAMRSYALLEVSGETSQSSYKLISTRVLTNGETLAVKMWSASSGTYARILEGGAKAVFLGDNNKP